MDAKTAFKFGFLARCAAEGLSEEETADRVKSANVNIPLIGSLTGSYKNLGQGTKALGDFAKTVALGTAAGGAMGLAAPMIGGGIGGYLLGRYGTDFDQQDIDEIKQRELIAEYNRLAEQAVRQRSANQFHQQRMG